MFHKGGARMVGGNLPSELTAKVNRLLDEFLEFTTSEVRARQLRSAVARSMLPCSVVIILDAETLWVAAQKQTGVPSTNTLDCRQEKFPAEEIFTAAKWEFGFDDPFIVAFQA